MTTIFVEAVGLLDLLWLAARHRTEQGGMRLLALYSVSRTAQVACALLRACGVRLRLEELAFDYVDDVVLPDGTAGKDELLFRACPAIVEAVESDPAYEAALHRATRTASHEQALRTYLSKRIFMELSRNEYPQLRSVTVVAWYRHSRWEGGGDDRSLLYVPPVWCLGPIAGYAARWGIKVCTLPRYSLLHLRPVTVFRRLTRPLIRWVYRFRAGELRLDPAGAASTPALRIAVDCYGQGITREPIYNTEWFWYRHSTLPPGAVFGYFHHPHDLITGSRRAWLHEAGIGWMDAVAARRLKLTPFKRPGEADPQARWRLRYAPDALTAGTLRGALSAYLEEFYDEYVQWYRFFRATNTRMHVSAFDMFAESEALHAALADLQGVSISLQRSIEADPNLRRRTVTDVHFAFSRAQADWERQSGSTIRQFITTGYPFDSAFPAARVHARGLRERLRARGARFIVCFLDQNLGLHPKWLGGQRMLLSDYRFLCDRLDEDPALGLILKPKKPRALPQRLGPVWPRLARLIDAGRCIMLDARSTDEMFLPCVAACAADVAINWIIGGTAGLESALAGTRTLLIRHRFTQGEFSDRLEGTLAFQGWMELWQAVGKLRANPADPAIGNWEPVIERYASLRDGKASERMQSYIGWLYEALASGRSKEQALADTGARYAHAWGADCIETIVPARTWALCEKQAQPMGVGQRSLLFERASGCNA